MASATSDELLTALAHQLEGSLIALDFDGTLAPLVDDPGKSRPVAGVTQTLHRLAHAGARIALVTGRDVDTVLRLSGFAELPGLTVSGVHGAQTWHAGVLDSPPEPPGIAELRRTLPPLLAAVDPAVWLEDKGLSLVVQTRPAADPEGAGRQLEPKVTALATAAGLVVHPGHLILEIRLPDLSKGDALRELLTPETKGLLYAGDDLGDLPAVTQAQQWRERTSLPAVTVSVGPSEELRAEADLNVATPAELATLLKRLLPE